MSDSPARPRLANNDEAVAYMKKFAVQGSGFSRHLGVEPIRCWEGESELVLEVRDDMTQHHGFAHGAIVGLMADNACAWAGASVIGDVVTGGYTINFLNPAIGSHLRAKGQVVKAGKRQVIVRADVWAESEGKEPTHVATAQATIIPTGR
ncbi:PaaI family thioesterase [Alterisphingorhabdus coralli]|uniref:PaaI family thioesterase n=1 Tax=Alterisphingorhabdus coralli TaxID=3071408 RepID=A0AA97I0E3_9SPHN|nr:PaaI family thioesterase [Parasphingorhabdus sp. SCSIO 66989]WOE75604.1 PaaI family thioesterase [Parasphingorhabdus sp. SCSIO 66989]